MSGLIEDILTNQDMGSLAVILSSLGVDFEDFMKNLQNTLTSLGITGLEDFNIDNIADMEEFFNEVTDFVNYIKTSTGFGTRGVNLDDIDIINNYKSEILEVKASGGIKTEEMVEELLNKGVTRLGMSNIEFLKGGIK